MTVFEAVSAIILIVACVFIVVVVLVKDTKTQMSQTISGSSSDSFYQKNAGRTREAMLNKATIIAAVTFFVLSIAVNVINVYWGGSGDDTDSTSSVVDDISSDDTSTESTDDASTESADDASTESADDTSTESADDTSTESAAQ